MIHISEKDEDKIIELSKDPNIKKVYFIFQLKDI
jgi:hypothetical protein